MPASHQNPPLLPLPDSVVRSAGDPVRIDGRLEVAYAGVRTPRLEGAIARVGAMAATLAPDPPEERPAVPVVLDCVAPGADYPAVDDDEAYVLEVGSTGVRIRAATEWGGLRALATLVQLRSGAGNVGPLVISDRPRFPWRGLMLDVARHFIPLDALERTLDAMWVFKLNVLHLHLSDDQAFRFPSRRFPRLPAAEHYTREQLDALVARAAERGIRIVPELDVPGHVACWLAAYPEWGNRPAQDSRRFGVHPECLDVTRPEVEAAVETLFTELAAVFPDRYLHMGGDEVHAAWWSEDPAVQTFMARHGLADAAALQARFHARLSAVLTGLGRIPLGWDEVLDPALPRAVTVQAWRGATARDRALTAGHDCVISAPYYLDLCYPADVHYGFDPAAPQAELVAREDALLDDPRFAHVAAGMAWTRHWRIEAADADPAVSPGRLLGAEACLWSELVDARVLDVRLWGRMPALAERFWSADCGADDDLYRRLDTALDCLPAWAGVDVKGDARRLAASAGVGAGWQPLVELLEPVKWYGRLLGEAALTARIGGTEMPASRPYDADTPLDRVVDALPPESAAARGLASLLQREAAGDRAARDELRGLAARWRALPAGEGPVELVEPAERLRTMGDLVSAVLDGSRSTAAARAELAEALRPMGEYLLAAAPLLLGWLDRRDVR